MAQQDNGQSPRTLGKIIATLFAAAALTITVSNAAMAASGVKFILFVNPLPKYPACV
jgi:hypothetical protein